MFVTERDVTWPLVTAISEYMSRVELEETWMPNIVEGLRTFIFSEQFSLSVWPGLSAPPTQLRFVPSPAQKWCPVKLCRDRTKQWECYIDNICMNLRSSDDRKLTTHATWTSELQRSVMVMVLKRHNWFFLCFINKVLFIIFRTKCMFAA